MGNNLVIGDKIIALNSHEDSGFRKGDIILVKKRSFFKGDFTGENLSRPDCYGNGNVYIGDVIKYRIINDEQVESVFTLFDEWIISVKRIRR